MISDWPGLVSGPAAELVEDSLVLLDHLGEAHNLVDVGSGGGLPGLPLQIVRPDLKVTLIDPEVNPGGVCLYRGCIPSKALLHVAKLIEESHQAKNWGIEFSDPKIDLAKLRGWKESVVNEQLDNIMKESFEDVVRYAETHNVNNRIAAYMLAIDRVAFTIRQRGIYA